MKSKNDGVDASFLGGRTRRGFGALFEADLVDTLLFGGLSA